MTSCRKKLAFCSLLVCFSLAFGGSSAKAAEPVVEKQTCVTQKKPVTVKARKKAPKKTAKAVKQPKLSNVVVRSAQEHLARLGYYTGKIDGVVGPQTSSAIKNFQREHGLKPTGLLDQKTIKAIEDADRVVIGSKSFMTHDYVNPLDAEVNQDYEAPLNGLTKAVSSRFARIDASEIGFGGTKTYVVRVNGDTILQRDGQPSVIGISKTYDLGSKDAIIFTTYNPGDAVCMFKNYVLAMGNEGNKLLEIENCTRAYKAEVTKGSLYISFPERDDNRMLGAMWRLEGYSLRRL